MACLARHSDSEMENIENKKETHKADSENQRKIRTTSKQFQINKVETSRWK